MLSSLLVNATDLTQWANRRDSQSMLPKLIRRLVLASSTQIERISFAADEGVSLGGWDGITIAVGGDSFVPDGTTVWEMGVNKDIKGKADSDYQKRSENPLSMNPSEITYIFITPRRWGGKDKWSEEKNGDGIWKEVRVYDADDLEAWISLAPTVHVWFSIHLGKNPQNCLDLYGYWKDWSEETEPVLSPELVLAGRDDVVIEINKWINNPNSALALQGETREETIAVFAATINFLPSKEKDFFFSRAIVVYNLDAWSFLSTSQNNLILIPAFDIKNFSRAIRNGHHILVPLGHSNNSLSTTVKIPRLSHEIVEGILVESGFDTSKVRALSLLARRGFTAFRRRLALSPEIKQPLWTTPLEARALVPILLAGTWNEANDEDKRALTELANSSYDEITEILLRWANENDPPIRFIGNTWYLVSKEDAWTQLVRYVTPMDMERFKNIVLEVLGKPDPKCELPIEKQWMAGIIAKSINYSGLFIRNLADTLAFMGSKEDSYNSTLSLKTHASNIIWELFEKSKGNWQIWATLSPVLPSLAEAAPERFLDALEVEITNKEVITKLFTDQENSNFGSSPHTGLLWALEVLAWSPEHFSRAIIALAKICNLDPGGKLSNRPENSLREIFLSWNPNTSATIEQRLQILEMLQKRVPDVAWELLCKLLPEFKGIGHRTTKPVWRDWSIKNKRNISIAEYDKTTSGIVKLILSQVEESGVRWEKVIKALPNLTLEDFSIVLSHLTALGETDITSKDKTQIWNALRDTISKHRSFPDSDWALPKELVDKVEEAYHKFEPQEPLYRYGWLFNNRPTFLDGREGNWEEQDRKIQQIRSNALKNIYDEFGIEEVTNLIDNVESLYQLGSSLGEIGILNLDEEDYLLEKYLDSSEQKYLEFARNYVFARIRKLGSDWAIEKLNSNNTNWSVNVMAEILTNLPAERNTWQLVESFGDEVTERYWTLLSPYVICKDEIEQAIEKFLYYMLPYKAIDLLAIRIEKSSALKIVDVFERALSISPKDKISTESFMYHISELFKKIQNSKEVTEDRIASLEWAYLPLLDNYGHDPKFLYQELSQNAIFFAEVVSFVYNSRASEKSEITEFDKQRITLGYKLLKSWRKMPGLNEDKGVDELMLMKWVKVALEETHKSGSGDFGAEHVGEILGVSPDGLDGAWPHEAVRCVIEEHNNSYLESGFEIGIYNRRGVVTKRIREGGGREQKLADKYNQYANVIGVGWPRTAKILRSLANTYAREAKEEDLSVEMRTDLGLP